jgi:hypothetical protein
MFEWQGREVLIHDNNKKTGASSIEVMRTGDFTLGQDEELLLSLYDGQDPRKLALMRVDLTVDVENVPVSWFSKNLVVANKQHNDEHSKLPETGIRVVRRRNKATIYFGKKPAQDRVYDKPGERFEAWKKEKARIDRLNRKTQARFEDRRFELSKDAMIAAKIEAAWDPEKMREWETIIASKPEKYVRPLPIVIYPTFEEFSGFKLGDVVTRCESQLGRPESLERLGLVTVGDLWRMDRVEPFHNWRFVRDDVRPLRREDFDPHQWLAGHHLMEVQKTEGLDAVRQLLREMFGQKNLAREWNRFTPFLCHGEKGISYKELQHKYEQSCWQQLHKAA